MMLELTEQAEEREKCSWTVQANFCNRNDAKVAVIHVAFDHCRAQVPQHRYTHTHARVPTHAEGEWLGTRRGMGAVRGTGKYTTV
jgi:hypothetical protein